MSIGPRLRFAPRDYDSCDSASPGAASAATILSRRLQHEKSTIVSPSSPLSSSTVIVPAGPLKYVSKGWRMHSFLESSSTDVAAVA